MKIRPERRAALESAARKILRGKSRYMTVERSTGVPWFVIGLEHYREADCSFACHLHNGDNGYPDANGRLTVRTRQVPAGRPASAPPWTWEDSARDALAIDGLNRVLDWGIERIGYMCEKFNGEGYFGHDVNSPYVWAGSNHYGDPPNTGKYVADHVFDPRTIETQLGCMPPVEPPVQPGAKHAAGAGIAAMVAGLAYWLGAHPAVVITLFVAVLAAFAF